MRKINCWSIIALSVLFLRVAAPAWGEDVKVTTSYPSPYGIYQELSSTGNMTVGGSLLASGAGATPASGAGTRLMWIPTKEAFRAGSVDGAQWDDANIGQDSVAFGTSNTASGTSSFVGGGWANTTNNMFSAVVSGDHNTASGLNSFVGGGEGNTARGISSIVAGGGGMGNGNTASGNNSFVGAGESNTASGTNSFIGGGSRNFANTRESFVGAGLDNVAGDRAFLGGGQANQATGYLSFVGGGTDNTASGNSSVVVGGALNTAGQNSFVGGGVNNNATGVGSFVGGGDSNAAGGNFSFSGGHFMQLSAAANNTFVWGYSGTPVSITTPDAFIIYDANLSASGYAKVGIGVLNPTHPLHLAGGAYSDGVSWIPGSSREYKKDIVDLAPTDAIHTVMNLNPVSFHYKQISDDHLRLGFIAEDVPELVATKDRKGVDPMSFIAILTKTVQEQQKEIQGLKAQVEALKEGN